MASPPPPPSRLAWTVHQTDAELFLRGLDDESVDCVITDPAYDSMEEHRARGGTSVRLSRSDKSSNDWFEVYDNSRWGRFFFECYRVMRPNTVLRVFADWPWALKITPIITTAGFRTWKPWVWDKVHIGMGYHGRARYELILYAEKGVRPLADRAMADVLAYNRVYGGFPAEKPVPLLRDLVAQHTERGQLVIDPFMGSGSTGEAALGLGRRFAGGDISKDAVAIAAARLNGLQ